MKRQAMDRVAQPVSSKIGEHSVTSQKLLISRRFLPETVRLPRGDSLVPDRSFALLLVAWHRRRKNCLVHASSRFFSPTRLASPNWGSRKYRALCSIFSER